MKKLLIASTVCAVAVGLSAVSTTVQAAKYRAKVGGGPTGGTFNTFANAMAVYIPKAEKNIKMSAVGSGGSVENIKRVSKGESQFGLCYAVDAALGWQGKLPKDSTKYDGLRAMGFLYGAPVQLVVRADSPLQSAKDLVGKRVAIGNAGSGAAASAERFFRHIDVWDVFKPTFLGYSAAASAFKDGKIDAFWVLVGYPNRSIIEASVQVAIRLIDVGQDAEQSGFLAKYSYLPAVIPAGTYGKRMPECSTFQDATILSCHRNVPEDIVYRVMKALWSPEGLATMVAAKKTFKGMTVENAFLGASVQLHPGAVKFWTEQGQTIPESLGPQ